MVDWSDDAIGESRVTKPDWVDFKASPPRPASLHSRGISSIGIHGFSSFFAYFLRDSHAHWFCSTFYTDKMIEPFQVGSCQG